MKRSDAIMAQVLDLLGTQFGPRRCASLLRQIAQEMAQRGACEDLANAAMEVQRQVAAAYENRMSAALGHQPVRPAPAEPLFTVGSKVVCTNAYGVSFPGKTITAVVPAEGGWAYKIEPTDTPWLLCHESQLTVEYQWFNPPKGPRNVS